MQTHYQNLLQRLKALSFSDSQIAALTYSSERAVQNWLHRRSEPSPLVVQQLARVVKIVEELRKMVNPVAFADWFFMPNRFLGKSAYQALLDGEYDRLQELTISLVEGSFA